MTRHVNLMQADMRPGHGRVQLPTFIVILTLTLMGCGLIAGYHWSMLRSLTAQAQQWQARVDTSAQKLRTFRQANPAMASEADLMQKNQFLTEQLRRRENALSGLAEQLGEASQGFSEPLASLSSHDLEGIWLSRIILQDSRKHLNLEGFARQPDLIPHYLSQLEGSVFEGLSIQNLSIQQAPNDKTLWRFSIADTLDLPTAPSKEGR